MLRSFQNLTQKLVQHFSNGSRSKNKGSDLFTKITVNLNVLKCENQVILTVQRFKLIDRFT